MLKAGVHTTKNGIKYDIYSQWQNMKIESIDYDDSTSHWGKFVYFWNHSSVPYDLNTEQLNEIENILENYNPLEIFEMVINVLKCDENHILLETMDEATLKTLRKQL